MRLDEIANKCGKPEKRGHGWQARCPAHDDRAASLSLSEGPDGRVLVKCHAGCSFQAIAAALGLQARDFFPERERSAGTSSPRIVKTYDYTDEAGALLYQVCRFEPKTFRQRRPHPEQAAEWVWSLEGVRRVLYRLPKLLDAAPETLVVAVEGEKDVEALEGLGIVATCNVAGAGKWPKHADETLLAVFGGREFVLVIADKDEPGRKHAREVAGKVLEWGCKKVGILELPDRGGKKVKDAADWIAAGGTREELVQLAERAPVFDPAEVQAEMKVAQAEEIVPPPAKVDRRSITSRENGRKGGAHGASGGRPQVPYFALADQYMRQVYHQADEDLWKLRYFHTAWYKYDGVCFREAMDEDIVCHITSWLQANYPQNASGNCLSNMVTNVKSTNYAYLDSWGKIPFWIDDKQTPAAGWIAAKNKLVHIHRLAEHTAGMKSYCHDEVFHPLTPRLFSTFGLPYAYDAEAKCPRWEKYLAEVQPEAADRELLAKLAGLMLIPKSYNVAFFLFGQPGTGKSVFLHVLMHLIGEANVCCVPLAHFGDRFSTFPLTTHLANIVGDLRTETERGDLGTLEGTFKDVCDGGIVPIERKHKDASKAPAIARCIFGTNSLPHFTDRSQAIWDRLRIIPFNVRFRGTGGENLNLRHELLEELPGILNWAIAGLGALLRDNPHVFPEHSAGAVQKLHHRQACDPERVFLEEHYEIGMLPDGRIDTGTWASSDAMYQAYSSWCEQNGHKRRNAANFAAAVQRVFNVERVRMRTGTGEQMSVYKTIHDKRKTPDETVF